LTRFLHRSFDALLTTPSRNRCLPFISNVYVRAVEAPLKHVVRVLRCRLSALSIVVVAFVAGTNAQPPRHNVILITLDGARVEEMFGGLDVDVLRSTLDDKHRVEDSALYKELWAGDAVRRREKLLPFFWGTLMRQHGSIAGNPSRGSQVRLTNRHWFSYPGYSEMLVGRAQDDVIKSNDAIQNPFPTVLEFLRAKLRLPVDGVATFASWSAFNAIAESNVGTLTINAGFEPYEHPDPQVRSLSALQFATSTPWDTVRHDVYTARLAMAHLATHKPQVLYLALAETDDWAHEGRYDRVLEAYMRIDRIFRDLWEWLQNQPEYRGRTSVLITTDHGRGVGAAGWRHHGEQHSGSAQTWMAFISPHVRARGEWQHHTPLQTRQVAATLLQWAGLDWREFDASAGPPVRPPTN
jgi:hypothetical protein